MSTEGLRLSEHPELWGEQLMSRNCPDEYGGIATVQHDTPTKLDARTVGTALMSTEGLRLFLFFRLVEVQASRALNSPAL